METIAEKAGIGDMYLFYRVLSGDAAHPSVTALNRYVATDQEGQPSRSLKWGPGSDWDGVAETLNYACHGMIAACVAVTELFRDAESNAEVAEHAKVYASLNGI
jgi:hypothetical protein